MATGPSNLAPGLSSDSKNGDTKKQPLNKRQVGMARKRIKGNRILQYVRKEIKNKNHTGWMKNQA